MSGDGAAAAPTVRPPDAQAVSTRDRIMREAATLFQTQGFAPTTMRAIATAAGLTPGALYWHFPSKESILYSILTSQSAAYDRTLVRARETADLTQRLRLYIRAMIEWQVDRVDPAHYLATIPFGINHLIQSLPPEQREHIQRLVVAHHDEMIQTVASGCASGVFGEVDPKVAGYAILNMCECVINWWKPDDPRSLEDLIRMHQELALRMLSPA